MPESEAPMFVLECNCCTDTIDSVPLLPYHLLSSSSLLERPVIGPVMSPRLKAAQRCFCNCRLKGTEVKLLLQHNTVTQYLHLFGLPQSLSHLLFSP